MRARHLRQLGIFLKVKPGQAYEYIYSYCRGVTESHPGSFPHPGAMTRKKAFILQFISQFFNKSPKWKYGFQPILRMFAPGNLLAANRGGDVKCCPGEPTVFTIARSELCFGLPHVIAFCHDRSEPSKCDCP